MNTETRNYTLGCYLVAFLDVLGQRQKFRGLQLPKSPEEQASVGEVLRQTAGFVVELREKFQKQFTAFEKGLSAVHQLTQEPVRPDFVGFSDSFVTSVPLWSKGGNGLVSIVTVCSALSAASVVTLTSLASRHPLRGGIDVGLATEIAPGEIYGTALERAYLLECREAQYPRIVIGDELWNYLNVAIKHFNDQKVPEGKAMAAVIKKASEMITTDCDGKRILDYLGKVMLEIAGDKKDECTTHMIRPAYDFVLAERERVLAEGNAELVPRYASLRQYFESRLALWGLDKK